MPPASRRRPRRHEELLVARDAPQSPEKLAAALIDLLTDEPKRLRIAAAGRKSFVEKFSNHAMAKRTVAHHEQLLARRK